MVRKIKGSMDHHGATREQLETTGVDTTAAMRAAQSHPRSRDDPPLTGPAWWYALPAESRVGFRSRINDGEQ